MKYQFFALALIALATVPSNAFLCFSSTNVPNISIFHMSGVEFCGWGSSCVSYRLEEPGSPVQYVRKCMAKNGHNDVCEIVKMYNGEECHSCGLPLCNMGAIPLYVEGTDENEEGEAENATEPQPVEV